MLPKDNVKYFGFEKTKRITKRKTFVYSFENRFRIDIHSNMLNEYNRF